VNMLYYYVWVRSNRYHGSEPLTYSSDKVLIAGQIIEIELQKERVLGIITGTTSKPRFQTKNIERVLDLPALPPVLIKVSQWLIQYYPAPLGIVANQLIPGVISEKNGQAIGVKELTAPHLSSLPPLTNEQATALEAIESSGTYLLHGITGSGKTRIYMELAYRAFLAGKSSVILTPEISLTTQLANNFRVVFSDRVVIMHSQQTPKERLQAWLTCLVQSQSEPLIVIGPRSALFSPLSKIGLIVMDEAHEAAYKQEQAPQYQTVRVASFYAGLSRSALILGTATPAVSDYFMAVEKKRPIIELHSIAQNKQLKNEDIIVVDQKDQSLFTRSKLLSTPLISSIRQALLSKQQSLLYLNRRGTARLVMCEECGWQATCPHCDLPLTYHGDHHLLRCHSCNFFQSSFNSCPVCGHPSILFKTAGTKAIVEEVQRLFPEAKVARFDTDNLKAERFEQHYEAVRSGSIDILVGTQLLAKGLDLPLLSTLGVIMADTSLYLPDFSAQEKTFQLITQVLGRIGRGHTNGQAIIQTYHPDHPVIKLALNGNYQAFYKMELDNRKRYLFPPYCFLLKISIRRASSKAAETAASNLKTLLESTVSKIIVEGPAPCFYERFQNKFQWQIIVKAKDRSRLIAAIDALPAGCSYDIDPNDLL
jgi:primosomal protein N' (replication factor Y)